MYVKKDLTIALEAMTICAGDCQGCFLTPEMRAASSFWSNEKLKKVGRFVKEMIRFHEQDTPIDDVGINLGQGDYLQLNKEQIQNLMSEVSDWTKNHASVFVTASGVTNQKKMLDNLKLFYDLSIENRFPLIFDVVMNSTKITGSFAKKYEENFININKVFGYFNIHINMAKDVVENLKPLELKDLLERNNAGFIAINFLATTHANNSLDNIKKITDWLLEFMEVSKDASYKINYLENIQRLIKSYDNDLSYADYLKDCLKNYKRNIFIDHYGNVFVIQEGFGDAPLTTRNNYKPICNVFDDDLDIEDIMNKISKEGEKITKDFFIDFNRDKSCKICDYQKVCMNTGGGAIKKVMNFSHTDTKCELGLKEVYNFIDYNYENKDFRNQGVFILKQKNLKDSLVDKDLYEYTYKETFNMIKKDC